MLVGQFPWGQLLKAILAKDTLVRLAESQSRQLSASDSPIASAEASYLNWLWIS